MDRWKILVATLIVTATMGMVSASPVQAVGLGDEVVVTDPNEPERVWNCIAVGLVVDPQFGIGFLLTCTPYRGACMGDRATLTLYGDPFDPDKVIIERIFHADPACTIFGPALAEARADGLATALAVRAQQEGWMSAAVAPALAARNNGTAPFMKEQAPAITPVTYPGNLTPIQQQYQMGIARYQVGNPAIASKSTMLASGRGHSNANAEYWQEVLLTLTIPRLNPSGPRTLHIDWGDGTSATQQFGEAQQGDVGIGIAHWYPDPYRPEDDPCGVGPEWANYTVKVRDTGSNQGLHVLHVQYPKKPRPDMINGGVWDC